MRTAFALGSMLVAALGCGESSTRSRADTTSTSGAATGAGGPGASSSAGGDSTTGGAGGGGATTTGAGGALPRAATFHLNYTQEKDWSKCADRDFVIFDLLETPAADFAQCAGMGAKMLCYFSAQYEDWRDDAGDFGALGEPLDGWPGERWVDPNDPANLAVMSARLDVAVQKGCAGVDVDNVDWAGHEAYVMDIYEGAREVGLLVSQKNAIASIALFSNLVDLYQNEQCQEYDECDAYQSLGRPVYNIEYTPCQTLPGLYSNRKDVEQMNAWEEPCAPP